MRFMIIRKADEKTEAGIMPSAELLAVMGQYVEEMAKAGIFVAGDGVQPSAKGARVKFSGGKPTIVDGPFAETKELMGGYCIMRVNSKEEAIEWVKRWPAMDGDGNLEFEIRQIFEVEDFGPELSPELAARQKQLRASL